MCKLNPRDRVIVYPSAPTGNIRYATYVGMHGDKDGLQVRILDFGNGPEVNCHSRIEKVSDL
jgi:hypothetical protein